MTHALFVDVTRTDRLTEPTPLSFLVEKVYAVPHGLAGQHWNVSTPFFSAADREKCRAIQARDRQGLAPLAVGPNDTGMFWLQPFETEERVPAARDMRLEEVFVLVKKVANCELSEQAVRQFMSAEALRGYVSSVWGVRVL